MNKIRGIFFFLTLLISLSSCSKSHEVANTKAFLDVEKLNITENSYQKMKCYFFFITDCPASRAALDNLIEIQEEYKKHGLEVFAILSDPLPDEEYYAKTMKEYDINFPIQRDVNLDIARDYGVTVTPQFVLFDEKGEERYNGMIDNYYYDFGKHRKLITEHYLEAAIVALLNEKEPPISKTKPFGCRINFD